MNQWIFIFILIFFLIAVSSGAELTVTMTSPAIVEGNTIFLKDIADIEGADDTLKKELGQILIDQAPPPGKTRLLKTVFVAMKIKGKLPEMYPWKMNAPEIIEINSAGQIIKGETLVKKVSEFIIADSDLKNDEVKIKALKMPPDLSLPKGGIRYEFVPVSNYPAGRYVCKLDVYHNDSRVQSVPLSLEIRRFEKIYVASRNLPKGSVIESGDIFLEHKEITLREIREGILSKQEELLRKETRRFIGKGAVITENCVDNPLLITRGEEVSVFAEIGQVKISAAGVARDSGVMGDTVQIRIPQSKKNLLGKVIGPGQVELVRSF